jgi:hypothetical protein
VRLSLQRRPASSYYQDATSHLGRKREEERDIKQVGLLIYLDYCGDAPK